MGKQTNTEWYDLWAESDGKHLCCVCERNRFIEYPEETTGNYEGGYVCDQYEGCYPDPDQKEDNGGGFWLVKCPFFKKDYNFYRDYMNSDVWRRKRITRMNTDGFKCQKCGSAMNLVVHHITYDRLGREPLDDLITLCESCHKQLHGQDIGNKARREREEWMQRQWAAKRRYKR